MGQSDLSLFGEEVEIGGGVDMEMGEKLKEIKTEVQEGFLELAVFQIIYTLRRVGDVD